jgi:hypothetical protein
MRTARGTVLLLAVLLPAGVAATDPEVIERPPQYKVGDWWTYQRTAILHLDQSRPKGLRYLDTITEITAEGIVIRWGLPGRPSGPRRLFTAELNLVDDGEIRYTPFLSMREFPLHPGKSWRASYDFTNRAAHRTHSQAWGKVEGWETVTVPAGTFRCLKIVVTTHGTAMGTIGTYGTDALRTECWSPEVRWFVRMEFYLRWAANPTVHDLYELVAFKPGE